jgi:hypothetical protein
VKDRNPSIKSTRPIRTKVEKKTKANNQQKSGKDPMQRVLMATK